MGKLQDKIAIVTGASSGIGLAIARAFGREGAAVVLAGRTPAPMEEAANEISANSGRALVRRVDVRDEKQVRQLVDATVKEFGGLDIYVNNAGVNHFDSVLEGSVEKWRDMLETNVIGMALGCREAARVMQGKGGHIVNVSSVAARYAEAENPMYAASKHAAGALTESLRLALQGKNIRITAVMPGAVLTSIARNMPQEQLFGIGRMFGIDPEQVGLRPGEQLPREVLDRVAAATANVLLRPENIADAVLFAVTQPETMHVNEIMVRPAQPLQMPGMNLPR